MKNPIHSINVDVIAQPITSSNEDWKQYLRKVETLVRDGVERIEDAKHHRVSWETFTTTGEAYVNGFVFRYTITSANSRRAQWFVIDGRIKTTAFQIAIALAEQKMNELEPTDAPMVQPVPVAKLAPYVRVYADGFRSQPAVQAQETPAQIEPLSTRKALALAVDMLQSIKNGKSYDSAVYYANFYRIQQALAIKTLANAGSHIVGNQKLKDWESTSEVINTALQAVKAERY